MFIGGFMKFTDVLYENTKEIWEKYYSHPFIEGITRGNLDIEKFKFYMIQDYFYLYDYAKLFALALIKTDDMKLIENFAKSIDYTINGEMEIHRSYMRKLGIDDEDLGNERKALLTTSYTSYMLNQAQRKGCDIVIISLLSCAWTYAEIAKKINEKNSDIRNHEFFGQWLTGYLSDDFQNEADFYKNFVNEFAQNITEEKQNEYIEIFKTCCIYELKFWDMAYNQSYD